MARGTAPPLDPEKLREARGSAGLSQAALARALRIARQRIIGYEQGREKPEIGRLAALAEALGVGVGDLVADGALPSGLAGLRTGAGLTLAAGAAALGAALPERSQAAANRVSLSAAERGRMPLSWQDQAAGEQVRTAMAGAYRAESTEVVAAWQHTFGDATHRPPAPHEDADQDRDEPVTETAQAAWLCDPTPPDPLVLATQVWGSTRTADQAWHINATVQEEGSGRHVDVWTGGNPGLPPAVSWWLAGTGRPGQRWGRPVVPSRLLHVSEWTSPWARDPDRAPHLPGTRPPVPEGDELACAGRQAQEAGATVRVTVHDDPEHENVFVLTGDHDGRLAPRTRWDGATGWGLWTDGGTDQEVPVSLSTREDLDGAVRELLAPLVGAAMPEADITWRSNTRRRLRAAEWSTWTLHAGLVPAREDIIVHGRCVGWLQHAPGGAGYTAHTPAGPLHAGPWKKREEAAAAVFAALWHPMPAPEVGRRALAPRRLRRKRPYGEPELCPHADAQLARAAVRPLGSGAERVYEVAVAGQVLGHIYRVATSGRARQWKAHPEGAESPRRSAPSRAEAVAALLSRPGPLWADPDLTIVH